MPLIGTLTSGVSALRTFSKGLEVIGGNIANVNTTAYKNSSTNFADTFANTVSTAGGTATAQIGAGVQLGAISTDFTQGSITPTGKTTDLAVSGNGYFVVSDTATVAGPYSATRDGSFHFDTQDRLVNAQGKFVLSATGTVIDISDTTAAASPVKSYSIGNDGTITVSYENNTTATQQVGLLLMSDQSKLIKEGGNLYDFSQAVGTAFAAATSMKAPGSSGLGDIQSSALELSNVDLTQQFSDLITTQRSFQAASRLVTVSDSVLEDVVNLKRA